MSQIITTIILIVLGAALCAGLEAAYFTMSVGRAKLLKEKGRRGGNALLEIKERIHHSIVTLVILNNTITIAGSIYIGHLTTELYGNQIIGMVSALLTATIIIFGEIIPKMIGENYSEAISLAFAPLVFLLTRIFTPIIYVVDFFTKGFMKENPVTSEEELKMLSQMGEEEGSIEHTEEEIIQRVFTLNDLTAKDIMTPRTVLGGLKSGETLDEAKEVLYNKPYSRYPVYEKNLDSIVGMCQSKDLLTALSQGKGASTVNDYMVPVLFVNEKKRVDDLLAFFQREHAHMAVAQDDFGGTAGVVTLEDVLEQLVGEIVDETDEFVDLRLHAAGKRK